MTANPDNGRRPSSRQDGAARRTAAGGPIRLLVSACLLGKRVRYDGGHKKDAFLVGTLGKFVHYVPVCPESDCGLPTPREPMRLVGDPSSPRLVGLRTGADHTDRMLRWTRGKLDELERLDLCGYICKKGSPSSGMEEGLFTRAFLRRFPLVPVEDEERLADPVRRETFIERVFTLRRFRDLVKSGGTPGALAAFHADHELLLLSHGRPQYSSMGRLVARAKELPARELYDRYRDLLLEALSRPATVSRRTDALTHAMGHLKKLLAPDERKELLEAIDGYRDRRVPLAVPATLIRHHVRKHNVPYLRRQVFLHPDPAELMLLNHV